MSEKLRFVRVRFGTKTSKIRACEIRSVCCRLFACDKLKRDGNRWTFEMLNRSNIDAAEVLLLMFCREVKQIDYVGNAKGEVKK